MMAFKTAKTKRSFTYSAVILLVISIFILTYWYYFIPNNRKTIHKNGFLILQTIADNIGELSNSRRSLYKNYYKNAVSKNKGRNGQSIIAREKSIDSLLRENKIGANVSVSPMVSNQKHTSEIRIENEKLIVTLFNDTLHEKVVFSENFIPLLESILSTQRSELFHSYLLGEMKDTTRLLYCDKELAIRSDKRIDSLLPKGENAYLPGIRDLNLHEESQKVFYYPFRVLQAQLMIGGFVDSKEYNAALRKVPFYFIYPLVIIFLLLLVLLPIIKFYVMDPNEQVRIRDVILFGLSVFAGASLITLMIIHYYLWKGEEYRVSQKLATLSGQIAKSFTENIQRSYEQLIILDKFKNEHRPKAAEHFDYSDTIKKFVQESAGNPSRYSYFSRIAWIDSSGEQKIRADLYSKPIFTNVKKRKYFDVFKKGLPYSLPGYPDKKIGLESVYSRTNTEFNIIISKEDTAAGGFIVALSTQPNEIINAILPSGYGFCIIDEEGNVQVHSDKNRNLNENFFQKIEPAAAVTSAVMTRQKKLVNEVMAYGKTHQMLVLPLDKLPFYLITFYDKEYIYPVNMRILVFTLAFCFLFFLTCMILWWAMIPKYKTAHQLLYCKLDAISWLIPRPAESIFYIHASLFVSLYTGLILTYIFDHDYYDISNFNILMFLIITPVNIAIGLSTIFTAFIKPLETYQWQEMAKKRILVWRNIAIHLIISLFSYYYTCQDCYITTGFLWWQLLINGILWVYAFSKRSWFNIWSFRERPFIPGYNLLATLLVLVLAVLPSALFTWYAHNQEIIQSVKRQQLHLAQAIRDRSFVIQQMKGANSPTLAIPNFYLDSMQFKSGIYTIYSDNFCITNRINTIEKETMPYEYSYFAIAEKVSTPYYKQQPFAGLTDIAADGSWHWSRKDAFMKFCYYPALPALNRWKNEEGPKMLTIQSLLPPRYIFLNTSKSFILLAVIIVLLLCGLYTWLRINLHPIFLTNHINGKINPAPSFAYPCESDWPSQEKMYLQEKSIAEDININTWLYNERWEKCSEKEKFLLYNIARDGLINYKNTLEIIALLKKGLLIVDKDRIKPFTAGFRAYILSICTEDNADMVRIQKKYLENSSWQQIRMPLFILLIGIAVIIFFTQQYIFDKLLILAGGLSTLTPLIISILGGSKQQPHAKTPGP